MHFQTNALANLRTETMKALWGKRESHWCPEKVLGVLGHPSGIEAIVAFIYKRLSDFRGLIDINRNRLHMAVHFADDER